jgi:hypothetical protein
MAWSDVQFLLEAEIALLPGHYRAAFLLCFLEGRSRAEAATELGISENTLSSRLARARERLQKRLARRGVSLSAVLAAAALAATETDATVPATVIETIARAAPLFAMRQSVAGISSHTLQLTNGAIQTMASAKIKWAAAILAIGGTLAVGTWGAGQGPGGKPSSGNDPTANQREDRPAKIQREADFAQRQRSLRNLKRIMTAMQNYVDTIGKFPTDVTDKDGKVLLSWRVQLLPYLEEDNLYKQFNLKEPWDSEQNLKLLARMPDVFRVGFEAKDATHTYYQRFAITGAVWANVMGGPGDGTSGTGSADSGGGAVGPGGTGPSVPGGSPVGTGTSGPPMGDAGGMMAGPVAVARFPLRQAEVTDGLSYTLGVIEAGPPVPWSKPADIAYHALGPMPALAGPFANVRNAATLDGTAHSLKPDLDERTMRRLIEPTDGQVIPAVKTMRARFPADTEEDKKALVRMLEQNQALIAALEEQISEHASLLALSNKLTRDIERAEEEQERLQRLLDSLKTMNKKLRDDLGLRRGAAPPKGGK